MVNEIKLGDCTCLNRDHRLLIMRVFKEAVERQMDIINTIQSNRADIMRRGFIPEDFITSSRDFIKKLENTRKVIQEISDCK